MKKSAIITIIGVFFMVCALTVTTGNAFSEECGAAKGLKSVKTEGAKVLPDPVKTDGDKYKVLLENEKVRVLEYRDVPGARTTMHYHPDFVVCSLSSFKRKLILGSGKIMEREFKIGEVLWNPAHEHIGENTGTTDTHVIIVELKGNTLPGNK